MTLSMLFVRLVSALKLNHMLLISNVIGVLLNISLNYVFMQYWGVVGIALSTVVVYMTSAAFFGSVALIALRRSAKSGQSL